MKERNFSEFLERMAKLDSRQEIISMAESEANRAERHRKHCTREYVEQIGQFLFFMRHIEEDAKGNFKRIPRPSNISNSAFGEYRVVVDALVNRGALTPKALDLFV